MADNPFLVPPVNVLQALTLGMGSYEGARKRTLEDEMQAGRKRAMQSLQQGGDLRGPLAELLGIGDVQGAKALAEFAHQQATVGHQGATLAEQKRFHDAQVANMEAQRRAEEGRLGLAQRAADQPIYKQGEEDPETGTRPWIMIPKGGTGMPEIIRPRGAEGPPGMTPAGPAPVAPGSPNLPNANTVPYAAINPQPIAQQGMPSTNLAPAPPTPGPTVAQAAPAAPQIGPAGLPVGTMPQAAKPPPGVNPRKYREVLAKEQAETAAGEPQSRAAALDSVSNLERLANLAKEIRDDPNLPRVLGASSYLPSVGEAANLQAKIDALTSQTSVAALAAMRAASKTGGAVGNVTEKEWPILQSQIAALSQKQLDPAYRKQLDMIISYATGSKGRIRDAYEKTHNKFLSGDSGSKGDKGEVVDWKTYFGAAMMPIVGMPDGTQVQFPDEMPADQIKGLIATKFPNVVPQEKTIGGAIKGVAADVFQNPPKTPFSAIGMAKGLYETVAGTPQYAHDVFTGKLDPESQAGVEGAFSRAALVNPVNPARALGSKYGAPPVRPTTEAPTKVTVPADPRQLAKIREDVPAPTQAELKTAATEGYQSFENFPAVLAPSVKNVLADDIVTALEKRGAYDFNAKQVHQTVDILRRDHVSDLGEIKSIKESLNGLKIDPDPKVRRAAGIADAEIDKFLSIHPGTAEAKKILDRADANYAAMKRGEKLEQAGEISDLRRGRAGYGGNINTLRQVLSPVVESAIKGNSRGWNPAEIKALTEIVEGDTATNVARGIGQLSPQKGSIATGIAIMTGGKSAAAGFVANKLANFMTEKQFERMSELTRKRSPAYEAAVERATEKYFTEADKFLASPSEAQLRQVTVAARALSAGLTRDGIEISSGDLLKYLGAPKGSAQDPNYQRGVDMLKGQMSPVPEVPPYNPNLT